MKRNKDGLLEFATKEEEVAYNKKKEAFLRLSDEDNARSYERQMLINYGYELPQPKVAAEVPSKPEVVINEDLVALAKQVSELEAAKVKQNKTNAEIVNNFNKLAEVINGKTRVE